MTHWLSEEEFIKRFDAHYRPHGIYLTESFSTAVTLLELKDEFGAPASPDLDEEDGLGPRHQWYGVDGDILFLLTCYPFSRRGDYTVISSRANRLADERYEWSFLEKLTSLPRLLLTRINRICLRRGVDNAEAALFYQDQYGIKWEVYRAESNNEAVELNSFLKSLKSEYDYFIDEPEDFDSIWKIIKSGPDIPARTIARYRVQSITEDVARQMSLADDAIYKVVEAESGNKSGLAFRRGKRVNGSNERVV